MATPADTQQPRGRLRDGRAATRRSSHAIPEAVEVNRARQRVQLCRGGRVMPVVLQHVKECSPDLERRAQCARVIPISIDSKDASPPPDACVQTTSNAYGKTLHRERKRASALSFYDEVQMID